MNEFREKANGLIFISHDLEQMRMLCDRVIVLDKGKCVFEGDTEKGCIAYEQIIHKSKIELQEKSKIKFEQSYSKVSFKDSNINLLDIDIIDLNNSNITDVGLNDNLIIEVIFKLNNSIKDLSIYVPIAKESNPFFWCIDLASDLNNNANFGRLEPGNYSVKVTLDKHNLSPGVYLFGTITFRNNKTYETYNKTRVAKMFTVNSGNKKLNRGVVNVNDQWCLKKIK